MSLAIKRIYAPPEPGDGKRILVDRLWPRGISKERAQLSDWMKDVAPSRELRQFFGHAPERMAAFAEAYRRELQAEAEKQACVKTLLALDREGPVTLLYAAKDPQINHAAVLLAYLRDKR